LRTEDLADRIARRALLYDNDPDLPEITDEQLRTVADLLTRPGCNGVKTPRLSAVS
jgi:hypothetical protein